MRNARRENVTAKKSAQMVMYTFQLSGAARKANGRLSAVGIDADHLEADRLAHTRDDGDVLDGRAVGGVDRLLPLDDARNAAQIDVQAQRAVAEQGGGFQDLSAKHGFFQRGERGKIFAVFGGCN